MPLPNLGSFAGTAGTMADVVEVVTSPVTENASVISLKLLQSVVLVPVYLSTPLVTLKSDIVPLNQR